MGNYWGTLVNGKVRDMEWSFSELYSKGYLPFTAPELAGTDPVDKADLEFTHKKPTITISELSSQTLTSNNYVISDVHFTVKDSKGNETYIGMFAKNVTSPAAMKIYTLSTAMTNNIIYSSKDYLKTELSKYTDGSYTLVISARVSTGELITVYTGTLTK